MFHLFFLPNLAQHVVATIRDEGHILLHARLLAQLLVHRLDPCHVASISLSIVLYDDEEQAEYFVVYDGDDDYDEDVDGEVNLVSQILCAGLVFQFKASRTRAPASRRP